MLDALGAKRFVWLVATAALTLLTLWMIFLWVPTERNLGIIQRAVYIHVPVAWVAMVAVVIVAIGSVGYLVTRRDRWDWLAVASAETGVVAGSLVLVTGSIWAKPIWNVWWTWDAKLTTTAILWFLYVAYLMLRAYAPPGNQGRRLAAVVAILGAVDAPLIYWAADLWRTAHPGVGVGPAAESSALSSEMSITLLVSVVTFTSLFAYILMERYRVRRAESRIAALGREAGMLPPKLEPESPADRDMTTGAAFSAR